ncbi:MAG: efflux RND transporter periplasmic adaptor subunit [Hyphomicrobiaceae bacterium]
MVVLLVFAGAAGYRVGHGTWPGGAMSDIRAQQVSPSSKGGVAKENQPVLYYRNPDGKPAYAASAIKTKNGRAFKPVFDREEPLLPGQQPAASKTAETGSEKKILYYRNPMGLPDTSPVPKKDWMGMDYIAVYEGEDDDGSTVTVSLDRVQRSGVRTERAEERRLSRPVKAPAVAATDETTMHSVTLRADAFIEKLYVEETGAHINKGQPLFRIYSPQMVNAQVDFRIALSEPSGRNRASALKGAKQKLKNFEFPEAVIKQLRKSGEPIMTFDWPAPVSGYVMKKNVVEGQMVRMGEELYMLAGLEKIWMIADVAEQDIGLVNIGQPAKVRFKAFPGEVFGGTVNFILHELQMETRTGKVRIELDNPKHRIKHEMFASVEIDVGAGDEPRVAVPNSAVINRGDRQVVIVARGEGKFEPREVELGLRGEGYTEIRKGIETGEDVVVAANFLIDAESNLKAALSTFNPSENSSNADAPKSSMKNKKVPAETPMDKSSGTNAAAEPADTASIPRTVSRP